MARAYPYDDAATYMAWRFIRGQKYARSMFEGYHRKTFLDWEKRHATDTRLQELTETKKGELGLTELRHDTVEYLRWAYTESKAIAAKAQDPEADPRRTAALSELMKAITGMGNLANNVYVDTDPLPSPPEAPGT